MDLKKRVNVLTRTALGLGALGFWMILLSFYVGAGRMLGEKSGVAAGWLISVAVELIAIACFIMFYVMVFVAPAVKDDGE
jgi:hypothetical protein